ncbi:unnamed protein product [Alopecurus aequalis]
MAGGWIVQLWTDSGIQIIVLLSFTFQVVLFFFAGIRRHKSSPVLTLLIWLVYLLADTTVIYALGHLSVASSSVKHQIVAFWAPLMLVHLGGPDDIAALWLRHFLILVVQTLGASYVFYKYVATASNGSLLQVASVLMFIVGFLKYGERTWALRCGSMDEIKSIIRLIKAPDVESFMGESVRRNLLGQRYYNGPYVHSSVGADLETNLLHQNDDNEEELLILAHFLLRECMEPFAGASVQSWARTPDIYRLQVDDMYKLIQMQLSLVYDIMYTKAWVIHTWYDYCISLFSLVGIITSILLFSFSNNNGCNIVDVDITYFLLAGVVVLEIISMLTTIGSIWMCAWLCSFEKTHLLGAGLKFLRRRVRAASRRWSSISIGQYNLLHLCTRDHMDLGSIAIEKMGLDKWWKRVHFVCSTDISNTHLPGLLLRTLPQIDPESSKRTQILDKSRLGEEQAEWCHYNLNLDFANSILIWNLATDIYLVKSKEARCQGDVAKAVKLLSNYMMFLLVTKPDMLPGYIDETLHEQNRDRLDLLWVVYEKNTKPLKNLSDMFKNLFQNDGPNGSRIPEMELFASTFHSNFLHYYKGEWVYDPPEDKSKDFTTYCAIHCNAMEHAAELLHLESSRPDLLEVIFGVWLEMLCYAAQRCGPESHATELSRGGEFITLVWLLMRRLHTL